MQISDFTEPKSHPFGMLSGYEHASEKESVLAFMLSKCVEAGDFVAVTTTHSHPTMVSDGLLEEAGDHQYKLTKKAIGLLYSQYAV